MTVRFRRNPRVSETTLDQETFLIDAAGREIYYLDAVTSGLWRLLEEARTPEDCTAAFAEAFPGQDVASLARDIERALAELEARELAIKVP